MKTGMTVALATAITMVIVSPLLAYTSWVGGLRQYETLELQNSNTNVTKVYDHDEGVVCYLALFNGGKAISCIKD